mgnify:CR=1 FL=1
MSDLGYESYREQQRELALEELWRVLPDYYIHNTHEEIVNNMLKVVEETYPEFSNYICPEDIDELVIEYTNSLR